MPRATVDASERGVALLETLLSLVLLGFALTGLARLCTEAAWVIDRGVRTDQALSLAISVVEGLQAAPFDDPGLTPGGDPDWPVTEGNVRWFLEQDGLQARWRIRKDPRGLLLLEVAAGPTGRGPGQPRVRLASARPAW